MRKRDHGLLANAASLLVCGLLAGVVVAAAAFPAVAMSGLAAKAGADTFDGLPTELTVQRSPQISYVYASDGKKLIATLYEENRRDAQISQISPLMQKAIVAAEDQNFYKHNGVDLKGIARAFVANQSSGETEQGASTLTMQYVRLAISYSASTPQEVVDATEDTNVRKLREIRYAMEVEKEYTKEQILERYLNIAPFGNGAYGVYAASQVYFNKKPADLTLAEAALLAAMVKAPSAFDPTTPEGKPQALDRRNWVLDQMVQTGVATRADADAAKQTDIKVVGKRAPNGCVSELTAKKWGFFCDYLYRWWLEQETFGASTYEREQRLKTGGYKIISSLDLDVQSDAKANVEQYYKTGKEKALMLAVVEPGTGRVRALAVNRNFKLDDPDNPQNKISSNPDKARRDIRGTYPNTTNPLMTGGGDIKGYQAGSTFKMFTMVAALEAGYPLDYTINAVSPYKSNYIVEYDGPASCPGTNKYCPRNATPSWMNGPRTMWSGFGRSVNTYFVPLEERVGADKVVAVAKKLGIQFRAKGTKNNPSDYEYANNVDLAKGWGAFTLGVSATTPLDLANAYATLAADGKYCEPTPVQEIRDLNGAKLDVADPHCRQAISKDVAEAAVDAARCSVDDQSEYGRCHGDTTAPGTHAVVGHDLAGKTGTTDGNRTASLVLITRQLAVAGILADPDWAQTTRPAESTTVNAAVRETMRDALKGKPNKTFAKPSEKMAYGDQRSIPDVSCVSVETAKYRLRNAGFDPVVSATTVESRCSAGTVARTDPSGRTVKGGVVMIYISNGRGRSTTTPGTGGGNDGGGDSGGGTVVCPPNCRNN